LANRTVRIYVESALATGAELVLDRQNAHYLSRVLRQRNGDEISMFNGDGNDYRAALTVDGKAVRATILDCQPNPTESPLHVTLVQGLAKGAKLDLVVQKATELGVAAIAPVSNDRSVLRVSDEKSAQKLAHWKKIAASACAQCNRSRLPEIQAPQSFANWLLENSGDATTLLLQPGSGTSLMQLPQPSGPLALVVGPEGGFSQSESELALQHGAIAASCGPRVLRTETAGFAAIAILQARFGDIG